MITKTQILADIKERIDALEKEISVLKKAGKQSGLKDLIYRLGVQQKAYDFNYWLAYVR